MALTAGANSQRKSKCTNAAPRGFPAFSTAASAALENAASTVVRSLFGFSTSWLAVHMLPAIGLPPELPGFPAADLTQRQIWWVATVVLSAGGLYLLVLKPSIVAKIAGIVLIAAPQVYGAPQPSDISSNVPAVLGAEFAVAALATTLFFWIVLGLSLGFANEKIAKAA